MSATPISTAGFWPGEYRHCPMCTAALAPRMKSGRMRMACPACGWVHFRDPAVGAAVLLTDETGRVLLVKRGPTSTRPGRWCIPCGFVDYGEDVRAAAARELHEETGLHAEVGEVIQVLSNGHDPAKLSIGIWFAGRITGGTLQAGDDAVDVGWFALDGLPELAFETDVILLGTLGDTR
ncbi:MAG: NUDIX domain-containing protein [Acidimicrobiia bacterium]